MCVRGQINTIDWESQQAEVMRVMQAGNEALKKIQEVTLHAVWPKGRRSLLRSSAGVEVWQKAASDTRS